jgi:anthranilate synthase/aminodeoxychorismate synthase-like glutamine amidotransferase
MTQSLPEQATGTATKAPVIIIDNYDSFSYNLYQLVQAQTDHPVEVYRNDAITLDELLAKKPHRVILSPGPGHPGIDKDFGICREIVLNQEALDCPVLGVCLGHQGIAHHLGGAVIAAPEIMHGKTSMINILEQSPLFDGVSNPFEAMRYHSLLIDEHQLPPFIRIIARENNKGLPMAIQHTNRAIYGIQFHPESIGTPEGQQMLRNFLEKC